MALWLCVSSTDYEIQLDELCQQKKEESGQLSTSPGMWSGQLTHKEDDMVGMKAPDGENLEHSLGHLT